MSDQPPRRAWLAHLALPAIALWIAHAQASDALLSDLDQRLARSSVNAVNAHLVAHWSSAMEPLNHKTAACELHAVSLAVRLARSSNSRAAQAHAEALRAATGTCARFVLAMAAPDEVPVFCGSVASWGAAQTARELRRRIAGIDADEVLRASRRGQTCRAAYMHELEHTRVIVRRAAADMRAGGQ